jgi:hypothetical protein
VINFVGSLIMRISAGPTQAIAKTGKFAVTSFGPLRKVVEDQHILAIWRLLEQHRLHALMRIVSTLI